MIPSCQKGSPEFTNICVHIGGNCLRHIINMCTADILRSCSICICYRLCSKFPVRCIVITGTFRSITCHMIDMIRRNKLCSFEAYQNISESILFIIYVAKRSQFIKQRVSLISEIICMLYPATFNFNNLLIEFFNLISVRIDLIDSCGNRIIEIGLVCCQPLIHRLCTFYKLIAPCYKRTLIYCRGRIFCKFLHRCPEISQCIRKFGSVHLLQLVLYLLKGRIGHIIESASPAFKPIGGIQKSTPYLLTIAVIDSKSNLLPCHRRITFSQCTVGACSL